MSRLTPLPEDSAASRDLTALALRAAIAAAEVIREIYAHPIAASAKADGSPVTKADAAAEAVILDHLAATGIPVLAEESVSAGRIPELGRRYFVVDPLDGTKEFLKRNGEFTVNIALVEDDLPVMGVVLAPVSGEAFIGDADGAYSCQTLNGAISDKQRISVAAAVPPRVVASRSHGHEALGALCRSLKIETDVSVGSSLKFCLLARGDAQLYPRFTPTSEWDTAAGQAVLEAAGGTVITLDGQRLSYGKREKDFLNPFFVAASDVDLARRAAAEIVAIVQ